jgi:hypothetical protein
MQREALVFGFGRFVNAACEECLDFSSSSRNPTRTADAIEVSIRI